MLELDRKVGEAIDIYVNNRLVARGEVVIVDERLGVTMTEIIKDGDARPEQAAPMKRTDPCGFWSSDELSGQLSTAAKMAMSAARRCSHVETHRGGHPRRLRAGQGADLLMVDYRSTSPA